VSTYSAIIILFQKNNYKNTNITAEYDYLKYQVNTLFISIKKGKGCPITCCAGNGESRM
jgi:hypothetical protein